eukprot:CAMPEP_0174235174 /NCGR_PEP_ID=MMETSP0417-20130205/4709_1 /TAXON_ID=242541 /ORGANISM="Mayorella sp, Strain BSH-02190019" /LENGTH=84 /DNA_ID=CAMNT_0015313647 /DNA_START=45 /DNA_END=296 /DNA_ORIENTATION=-
MSTASASGLHTAGSITGVVETREGGSGDSGDGGGVLHPAGRESCQPTTPSNLSTSHPQLISPLNTSLSIQQHAKSQQQQQQHHH